MKTIETTVTVDESGQLTMQVPDDVMPGRHHVVLVIDEGTKTEPAIATNEIDAAFAEMANDAEYQAEALQLEAEFAVAQWEALQIAEGPTMKRGEVYDARLDPTEGSEQAGERPVIVVSRNAINAASSVILGIPCTTYREGRRIYPSQILIAAPEGD